MTIFNFVNGPSQPWEGQDWNIASLYWPSAEISGIPYDHFRYVLFVIATGRGATDFESIYVLYL